MKIIISLLFFINILFASYTQEDVWWKGETLLTFLDKHNINKEIYFSLSKTDKELCSEIYAGVLFQVMYNQEHKLEQTLIPISEEMQIHIFKDKNNNFTLDIIPIEFQEIFQTISIPIKNSPYEDIRLHTGNKALANEFILAFKKSVRFTRLQKGDMIAIQYKQKIRLGRYFGTPTILGSFVKTRGKYHYIFQNPEDNNYYNKEAKSLTNVLFKVPLKYKRVSSKFTYKRYHPILKKYRAHLGVDYAAPTGRAVYATADGKVIHKARKGGYGKTVMIKHKNGYKSLYAHLNSYSSKIKKGSYVKQGTFIGRVGSTGRSTGPHLHFGIYKNGRAVNPQKVIKSAKVKLAKKNRKKFEQFSKKVKKSLLASLTKGDKPIKLEKFELSYKIQ
ncbi:MAG: peptidoglycan DD-metalloendopeptidase family protein [Campylobacterota bacterium]|nr:peptidoglycan DD-metalloendopeptidase family protein [Campylobacterota bacterium]